MLLYESHSAAADTIKIYLEKKSNKFQSRNHAIWAINPKHFDKVIVDTYLKGQGRGSDSIMALVEVRELF